MEALQGLISLIFFLVFIFLFWGLILILPQRKRMKKHEEMVLSIEVGDEITTSTGIVGEVTKVDTKTFILKTADCEIEILKNAAMQIDKKGN